MRFIPLHQIKPGMVLAQDIYVFYSSKVSLLRKGQALTRRFIERLQSRDIPGIYARDEGDDAVPAQKPLIAPATREKAVSTLQAVFQSALAHETPREEDLSQLDDTVATLVSTILRDERLRVNIEDLRSYDECTYHHSLSVCVLCIATGITLGLREQELQRLGLAAILHDIGKVLLPVDLINKPSRLTPQEYDLVKQHAQLGGNYILAHHLGNALYGPVVGHHERVDGTGYPMGLTERQIPRDAKIISIADVYDALTSKRPYREPMPISEAVEYLMGGCGTQFDIELVRAFLRRIEAYPVGAFVELSDGRKGVVMRSENVLRPVVKLINGPGRLLDLYRDESLRNLVITRVYRDVPETEAPPTASSAAARPAPRSSAPGR